jgi:uncharacterized membrane protein YfcA
VLAALLGIIISLFVNAWPTFQKFGFHFLWRVEWDIVNAEFGAAIAIVGMVFGAALSKRIASIQLQKAFGWFVLTMGVLILTERIFTLNLIP